MAQLLYASNIGLLQKRSPFGDLGDFVTGPMMTPHFGEIVVKTSLKAHYGDWLEWGPGRGDWPSK